MLEIIRRIGKCLLIVGICSCAITGCVESNFALAKESKLPRSMTLPPGLSRTDVSVTLNLYAPLLGPDATFVLTDRKGKRLAEVKGKTKESTESPCLHIVTEKGITEFIKLKPYREHENMEQDGTPVALFYVIDDSAEKTELQAGCQSVQKK